MTITDRITDIRPYTRTMKVDNKEITAYLVDLHLGPNTKYIYSFVHAPVRDEFISKLKEFLKNQKDHKVKIKGKNVILLNKMDKEEFEFKYIEFFMKDLRYNGGRKWIKNW